MSLFADLPSLTERARYTSDKLEKGRPKKLEKQDRVSERQKFDDAESAKARIRAGGRCEVFIVGKGRCTRKDLHTHHMISGNGKRARGVSALAEHKQRTCVRCHDDIGGHVLKLLQDGPLPHYTDAYERIR